MATTPEDYTPDWLDTDAAKKNNGIFTNRIFVQHLGEGMLRLNFGEILAADDPSYHTALVISAANAVTFAELIYRMGNAALTPPPPPIIVTPQPPQSEANGE